MNAQTPRPSPATVQPDAACKAERAFLPAWWPAAVLGFFLLGAALYWPALSAGFVSDDYDLVDTVRRGGPFAIWTHAPTPFFRPLISLSLWADAKIWGLNAAGFHAANIIVHVLNSLLVAAIARRLLAPSERENVGVRENRGGSGVTADWLALASGGLFLMHPAHAEAVAWIAGRTDVFATFFYLASFLAYLLYRGGPETAPPLAWLGLSLLLFVLSLSAKEFAVTLPALVFAYEAYHRAGRLGGRFDRSWVAFLLIAALYVVIRRLMIGQWVGGVTVMQLGLGQRLAPLFFVMGAFLPRVIGLKAAAAVLAALVAAGYARRGSLNRSRIPLMGFCLAGFSLTLLPVLPLMRTIPMDGQVERLIYVGTAFSCLLIALAADALLTAPKPFLAAVACLAALNGSYLYRANQRWQAAGALCRRLLADAAATLPARELIFLDTPDTLSGAYVFRNGLFDGLRMLYGDHAGGLVATHVGVRFASDEIILTRSGEVYDLRGASSTHFTPDPTCAGPVGASGVTASAGGGQIRVRVHGLGREDRVLYYSAGRFLPAPPAPVHPPAPSPSSQTARHRPPLPGPIVPAERI